MPRLLPLEEGYMRIPEEPNEPPRLIGSYSPAADTYFFPRRKRCPITFGPVEDRELSPDGVLYSWTFVRMPSMGSRKLAEGGGYGVGQIDLPEGVRIQAMIEGKMGDWEIGMKMVLKPLPVMEDEEGNTLCTFQFAPAEQTRKEQAA